MSKYVILALAKDSTLVAGPKLAARAMYRHSSLWIRRARLNSPKQNMMPYLGMSLAWRSRTALYIECRSCRFVECQADKGMSHPGIPHFGDRQSRGMSPRAGGEAKITELQSHSIILRSTDSSSPLLSSSTVPGDTLAGSTTTS